MTDSDMDVALSRNRFVQRHRGSGVALVTFGGSSITVRDNLFLADPSVPPMAAVRDIPGAREVRVRRNRMDRIARGLVIDFTSAGLIEDNVAVGSAANGSEDPADGGSGISLGPDASSVLVETNRFKGFAQSGIEVAGAGNTMVGNDFRGNSAVDCVDTAAAGTARGRGTSVTKARQPGSAGNHSRRARHP